MSADSDQPRPSFRFRDQFSRLKDKVKDKVHDKAIKHNITAFVHHNLTSNDTQESDGSRHGFRQQLHQYKEALKNKTHYNSLKDKVKEKIDDKLNLNDNKTYPKGFYDALFSPETENDVYVKTAVICLWAMALLCIIPTLLVIFLPGKKEEPPPTPTKGKGKPKPAVNSNGSTNMIFFHVFLCELFYLMYVLLAMINVAQDFHLSATLCDVANYGMYVTIPIMQFALLFLSLERLSRHCDLKMTCCKIFTKPYLIQVILSVTWVILLALLVTFMLIRKQFSFNFIKDRVEGLAPPIVGDVVSRFASRRHHCSIDGRLSSVFKVLIIVLFVVLIVKPISLSLGFNLLSPFVCKNKHRPPESGDRRTTTLVTIFLLLNLVFSFPFYFASMFNSVLTRIDATKDVFNLVLKICFIMRITNIIFECLAFCTFEHNSWRLLSKLCYYCTCKKMERLKVSSDDDVRQSNDPDVQKELNKILADTEDEEQKQPIQEKKKKKTTPANGASKHTNGTVRTNTQKSSTPRRAATPPPSDQEELIRLVEQPKTPRKPKTKEPSSEEEEVEVEEDQEEITPITPTPKRKSPAKQPASNAEESKPIKISSKPKPQIEVDESENEEVEAKPPVVSNHKPSSSHKRDDVDQPPKRKSHRHVTQEEEMTVEKPRRKSHQPEVEVHIPNGKHTRHRSLKEKSTTKPSTEAAPPRRRKSPVREPSSASEAPSTEGEPSPRPPRKRSSEHRRTQPTSSRSPHRSRTDARRTPSKKKSKETQLGRILKMSDPV